MKKNALFLLLIFFLLASQPLNANQSIQFQAPVSFKENQVVNFIQETQKTPQIAYIIATEDLNGDFISEYILQPQNRDFCENGKLCPYLIVAYQADVPILIGQFDAHKILISNKKTYGINHIIVYNDLYNDFKTTIAAWDPFSYQYTWR